MHTPLKRKLTIITVTLNACSSLARTIQSVISQKKRNYVEFIVIDGLSEDGSLELLEQYSHEIDLLVSSKDRGVYDAMNRGVSLASTEWIYFLNAGDIFVDDEVITRILEAQNTGDVLYSDVIVNNNQSRYTFRTSFEDRKLNHQGFVYKKHLHEQLGKYAVIKGFTAADYLFFLQLHDVKAIKLEAPIAIFQAGGLSSTVNAVQQKYCLDFLAGKTNHFYLACILLFYPLYRRCKMLVSRLTK